MLNTIISSDLQNYSNPKLNVPGVASQINMKLQILNKSEKRKTALITHITALITTTSTVQIYGRSGEPPDNRKVIAAPERPLPGRTGTGFRQNSSDALRLPAAKECLKKKKSAALRFDGGVWCVRELTRVSTQT